jgi:hypothetical protein
VEISWESYWEMERVKGIEPSYSAWKPPDLRNVFNDRHFSAFWAIEIATEFLSVRMAIADPALVLFSSIIDRPFAGAP